LSSRTQQVKVGSSLSKIVKVRSGVVQGSVAAYSDRCQALCLKAERTASAIRRAFSFGAKELLWPAFQYYVLPSLMYCSSVRSPYLQADVFAVEHVQRKFTKSILGLRGATYQQRLQALNALSLVNRRIHSDMILVYNSMHGLAGYSLQSLGMSTSVTSCTRSNQRRLQHQRSSSRVHAGLSSCRAPREWNEIPINIINSQLLTIFKNKLYSHLMCKQEPDP
jgi:hypothetical protein